MTSTSTPPTPPSLAEDPFPRIWAHAVNSLAKLKAALLDQNTVTSIECDVMTRIDDDDDDDDDGSMIPILSHPPSRSSDLTLKRLLEEITQETAAIKPVQRNLIRNLKLDFKEIQALKPSLDLLRQFQIYNPLHKSVILNADILPGPGKREPDPSMVPAKQFLSTCLEYIMAEQCANPNRNLQFVFSLGYRCDWTSNEGYTASDADAMTQLVDTHQHAFVDGHIKIVLALNARLLAKNVSAFDPFLLRHGDSGILAWTGSGEPPIPLAQVELIQRYFVAKGLGDRIEFDCCIDKEENVGT